MGPISRNTTPLVINNLAGAHTYAYTYAHTYTHAHSHTHTHTHTHTNTLFTDSLHSTHNTIASIVHHI